MSRVGVSSVGSDIFSAGGPPYGNQVAANNPGSFGLSGPNVPSASFGPNLSAGALAQFTKMGQPPKSHGSIGLKSWEHLSYTYLAPPTNDNANLRLKSGMLVFTMKEMDNDDGATLTYPLFMLNQLMRDQWNDFVNATSGPAPDLEMIEFLGWMQKYGEQELMSFHKANDRGDLSRWQKNPTVLDELRQFEQRATLDGYCYLTLFGIMNKVNFAGVVINTNHAESLDQLDMVSNTRHYSQVNIGLAKRVMTAQCFGPADQITSGSTVWICLKREFCHNGKYGCYVLYPGGSTMRKQPLPLQQQYVDERGDLCKGHVWIVGTVIDPAKGSPQPAALEAANNTGTYTNSGASVQMFGSLPTMYLAVGYRQ